MVPLAVTATLTQGIVLDPRVGLALDGLLASQVRHRARARAAGPDGSLPSGSTLDGGLAVDAPADPDLPLARCPGDGTADGWHWAATFGVAVLPDGTPARDAQAHYRTGRLDGRQAEHAARPLPEHIPERNGRYKARRAPDLSTPAAAVLWRAVGDPDAVLDLLAPLPAIGSARSRGEGAVRSWQVTAVPGGDPHAHGHLDAAGSLARPCPHACLPPGVAHQTGPAGLRPPYWHPARQALLALPTR